MTEASSDAMHEAMEKLHDNHKQGLKNSLLVDDFTIIV
jgi:hypothetical protein